jgi:hypothetical protein
VAESVANIEWRKFAREDRRGINWDEVDATVATVSSSITQSANAIDDLIKQAISKDHSEELLVVDLEIVEDEEPVIEVFEVMIEEQPEEVVVEVPEESISSQIEIIDAFDIEQN